MSSQDVQAMVDSARPGNIVKLDPPRKEFQGPVTIRQALTIEGQGGTLWAPKGPVLLIESNGVVLNDMNVEITSSEATLSEEETYALIIKPGLAVTMKNVLVRGNVRGLDQEEGTWRYPRSLRLGSMQAGKAQTFTLRLVVPVPCELQSEISGVSILPKTLSPGAVEVTIKVDALSDGTRLRGGIKIRTPLLTRRMEVSGNFQSSGKALVVGDGECLFEAEDWADVGADPPSGPRPQSETLQVESPPAKKPVPPPVPQSDVVSPDQLPSAEQKPSPAPQQPPAQQPPPARPAPTPTTSQPSPRTRKRRHRQVEQNIDAFQSSPPVAKQDDSSAKDAAPELNEELWDAKSSKDTAKPQDSLPAPSADGTPPSQDAPVSPPARPASVRRKPHKEMSGVFAQDKAKDEPPAETKQPDDDDGQAEETETTPVTKRASKRRRGAGDLPGVFGE